MANEHGKTSGYHLGSVDTVMSVDEVARQAERLREEVPEERLLKLAGGEPFVSIVGLRAGYGNMRFCTTSRCTSAGANRCA